MVHALLWNRRPTDGTLGMTRVTPWKRTIGRETQVASTEYCHDWRLRHTHLPQRARLVAIEVLGARLIRMVDAEARRCHGYNDVVGACLRGIPVMIRIPPVPVPDTRGIRPREAPVERQIIRHSP